MFLFFVDETELFKYHVVTKCERSCIEDYWPQYSRVYYAVECVDQICLHRFLGRIL